MRITAVPSRSLSLVEAAPREIRTARGVVTCPARNTDEYRDAWIEASEGHGVLVLSPMYSEEAYGFGDYHMGGLMYDLNLDRMFERATAAVGSSRESYDLFGHSAGAQILHRLALLRPGVRADRIVAANSGFYTLPVLPSHGEAKGRGMGPRVPVGAPRGSRGRPRLPTHEPRGGGVPVRRLRGRRRGVRVLGSGALPCSLTGSVRPRRVRITSRAAARVSRRLPGAVRAAAATATHAQRRDPEERGGPGRPVYAPHREQG